MVNKSFRSLSKMLVKFVRIKYHEKGLECQFPPTDLIWGKMEAKLNTLEKNKPIPYNLKQ